MENAQENGSTLKYLGLFVSGILVVGSLTFFLTGSGNKPVDSVTPIVIDTVSETVKGVTTEAPKEINLDKKENKKMTVEQKLAIKASMETIDASKNYTASLKTSLGDIVLELDVKNRPQTVNNFVYLTRLGFYDNIIFHRVIAGFMIQGGDPLGTGTGGPAYKFSDELTAPNSNAKGTIAMANSGPNTNGSQFFINLVDNNFLDTKHTVFGKVTSGMDVVEKIGKTPVGQNDLPLTPVVINSVEIVQN